MLSYHYRVDRKGPLDSLSLRLCAWILDHFASILGLSTESPPLHGVVASPIAAYLTSSVPVGCLISEGPRILRGGSFSYASVATV